MSFLPYAVAVWVLIVGLYGVVTSRHLKERLEREALHNVSLRVEQERLAQDALALLEPAVVVQEHALQQPDASVVGPDDSMLR